MTRVNAELGLFDSALAQKPQLVAVNKIDLPEVKARLDELRSAFACLGIQPVFISAATGEGVSELMAQALELLSQVATTRKVPAKVFRPQPKEERVRVRREEGTFVVSAPELERILARVDMSRPQVRRQVDHQLARLGVRQALERAGIKPGDRVRCGDTEWEW